MQNIENWKNHLEKNLCACGWESDEISMITLESRW